jgi:hypothetical protein
MIDIELKHKIEDFFDYSWNNGRNFAVQSEADVALLD